MGINSIDYVFCQPWNPVIVYLNEKKIRCSLFWHIFCPQDDEYVQWFWSPGSMSFCQFDYSWQVSLMVLFLHLNLKFLSWKWKYLGWCWNWLKQLEVPVQIPIVTPLPLGPGSPCPPSLFPINLPREKTDCLAGFLGHHPLYLYYLYVWNYHLIGLIHR